MIHNRTELISRNIQVATTAIRLSWYVLNVSFKTANGFRVVCYSCQMIFMGQGPKNSSTHNWSIVSGSNNISTSVQWHCTSAKTAEKLKQWVCKHNNLVVWRAVCFFEVHSVITTKQTMFSVSGCVQSCANTHYGEQMQNQYLFVCLETTAAKLQLNNRKRQLGRSSAALLENQFAVRNIWKIIFHCCTSVNRRGTASKWLGCRLKKPLKDERTFQAYITERGQHSKGFLSFVFPCLRLN